MTLNSTLRRRLTGAASVAAVVSVSALGGAGLTPAQAASDQLTYNCELPILGAKELTASADTTLPETVAWGQVAKGDLDAKVVIPADISGLIYTFLGARKVSGTADLTYAVDGVDTQVPDAAIAETEVPQNAPLELAVHTPVSYTGAKAGSTSSMVFGEQFTAVLTLTKQDGSTSESVVPCSLKQTDPAQDTTFDRVAVVKDGTRTAVKAPDIKKGKKATASVTVRAKNGGAVRGAAQATLYKGKKKLKTVKVALKAGKGTAALGALKKTGAYTVKVAFKGNANLKPSQAQDAFKVS